MHILEIFEREFSSRYLDIMKIQIALIVTDGQSIQEWIDSLLWKAAFKNLLGLFLNTLPRISLY